MPTHNYFPDGFDQSGLYPPVINYKRVQKDCHGHDITNGMFEGKLRIEYMQCKI